jgi:hypothetical protein
MKATKKPRPAPPQNLAPAAPSQSWLERLPVELIEQIFLHALEVNMAKASPFLGRSLAKESIYRTLILFAFFDDDDSYPVETKHFAPATYRMLSLEERLRLQQGVLDSRWCTKDRLEQSLPTFRRLVIVQEWHRQRSEERDEARALAGDTLQKTGAEQPPSSQQPQCASSLPALDDEPALVAYYRTSDEYYPSNYTTYISIPSTESSDDIWTEPPRKTRSTFSVLYFPNRLLDPESWEPTDIPFSSNTNDSWPSPHPAFFLYFLIEARRMTANVNTPLTAAGAALIRGLETAIRQHEGMALKILLQIFDMIFLSSTSSTQPGGGEENVQTHENPRECVMRLLHLATRQGTHSRWILPMLIEGRDELVSMDDEVLMKWGLRSVESVRPGVVDDRAVVLRSEAIVTQISMVKQTAIPEYRVQRRCPLL